MSHPDAADAAAVDAADGRAAVEHRRDAASELFRALSSPVRIALIERLAAGDARVGELVETLGISQPLTSQHLRVLRAARLVTTRREGREITYALGDEHVAHIVRDALAHADEAPHTVA